MQRDDLFSEHPLGDGRSVWTGSLPDPLRPDEQAFDRLWSLRPERPPTITVNGWTGPAPRYKQAYLHDYRFSGQTSRAADLPSEFAPFVDWAQETVDDRLNGALANWYDASEGHYIGPHRDKTGELVDGSPIVTMSFGDRRIFRMREYRGDRRHDLVTVTGLVIVMPWEVNKTWKHEIVATKRPGRRISLTLRCFR